MAKLKNRQMGIPHGFRFYEPITQWKPPKDLTFDAVVRAVIEHRQGNKSLSSLPTDYDTVAEQVDTYNAGLCKNMGWLDYVEGLGGSVPKVSRPRSSGSGVVAAGAKLKTMAAGAVTLAELFGPGKKPVAKAESESRAALCVGCDQNQKGDVLDGVTAKGGDWIRRAFGFLNDAKLATTNDAKLGVCQACHCPLRLKVHVPLDFVRAHTDAEQMAKLPGHCWIKTNANE